MNDALSLLHPKTGPSINKGQSKQDYGTPWEFVRAVVGRFGSFSWDLAANEENRKTSAWYGVEDDSLSKDWHKLPGLLFLNPPFSSITPWAKKCAEESRKGARILFLVPSSTGANWFRDWVWGHADIYFLNGRLTFEGCSDPYPKDCLLGHYCPLADNEYTHQSFIWDWRKDLTYPR